MRTLLLLDIDLFMNEIELKRKASWLELLILSFLLIDLIRCDSESESFENRFSTEIVALLD